jgi:hypothetical protein
MALDDDRAAEDIGGGGRQAQKDARENWIHRRDRTEYYVINLLLLVGSGLLLQF